MTRFWALFLMLIASAHAASNVPSSQTGGTATLTVMLPGDVPLELVKIPAGTFTMGSAPDPEAAYKNPHEAPRHPVVVGNDFYMGKYEVTQKQWFAVMGTNTSDHKGDDNCPVENVSWNDCRKFIAKLNALKRGKFRLPAEAEWEYACRAGTQTRWPFGDGPELLKNYAWYDGNSTKTTHAVGGRLPNALGLYDMLGNVGEWCEDDWHDQYAGAPAVAVVWIDGAKRGPFRVIRGGSYDSPAAYCRPAARYSYYAPSSHFGSWGLRVVMTK
ncbi:MAG: formylglycine-generating enzyme family protein [Candidatus Sumerlaeia bacterium]